MLMHGIPLHCLLSPPTLFYFHQQNLATIEHSGFISQRSSEKLLWKRSHSAASRVTTQTLFLLDCSASFFLSQPLFVSPEPSKTRSEHGVSRCRLWQSRRCVCVCTWRMVSALLSHVLICVLPVVREGAAQQKHTSLIVLVCRECFRLALFAGQEWCWKPCLTETLDR